MGKHVGTLALTIAAIAAIGVWPAAASTQRVCWPGVTVPPVHVPAVTLPALQLPVPQLPLPTIPGTIPAVTIPAVTIPVLTIPAITIPGYTLPARCFDTAASHVLPPSETTVRIRNYRRVDTHFSLALSIAYWRQTGTSASVPNYGAKGFGELNAAGFAKNQYVRSYFRVDGTFVRGHWRHSPSDGLPTCKIIRC